MNATGSPERGAVRLYVIPGSHACRAAMLALAHKRIEYRLVELPTGPHPFLVRLHGFPGHPTPIRSVDGRAHAALALLDRMGTVPALKFGSEREQTNRKISRFLDRVQPEPALFPADPEQRRVVEEAELWADEAFQMAARRIVLAASLHGLDALGNRGGRGRLGPLLAGNEPMRMMGSRIAGRFAFRATADSERELLDGLPAMLETIDAWIAAGVLNGPALNAADFLIAPSLALLAYRRDLRAGIEARPAGALLERVLPEPVSAVG
jgi:glutathione S-transferase